MILTLAGRLLQFALMFVSLRLMTTYLPPIEMGKLSLITTGTTFFALFLINPVGMFINRRLHAWTESGRFQHYFHVFVLYVLGVAWAGGLLGAMIAAWKFAQFSIDPLWAGLLILGSLLFNTLHQTLIPSLNLLGRTRSFVVLTVGTLCVALGFSVIGVRVFGPTVEHWLIGALLAQALFSGMAYWFFFSNPTEPSNTTSVTSAKVKGLFRFSWPVALSVVLAWCHQQGYRFVLAELSGVEALGFFAVGYGVAAALMGALEMVLTTWFQPAFYKAVGSLDAQDQEQSWAHYAAKMLPLSVLGLSVLVASVDYLSPLMLGPQYQGVTSFIMLGALAEWGRIVLGVFTLEAHAKMQTMRLVAPNLLAAVVSNGLIVAAVPHFGLQVAPVAVFLGVAVSIWMLRHQTKSRHANTQRIWASTYPAIILSIASLLISIPMNKWLQANVHQALPYIGLMCIGLLWSLAIAAYVTKTGLKEFIKP